MRRWALGQSPVCPTSSAGGGIASCPEDETRPGKRRGGSTSAQSTRCPPPTASLCLLHRRVRSVLSMVLNIVLALGWAVSRGSRGQRDMETVPLDS